MKLLTKVRRMVKKLMGKYRFVLYIAEIKGEPKNSMVEGWIFQSDATIGELIASAIQCVDVVCRMVSNTVDKEEDKEELYNDQRRRIVEAIFNRLKYK